MIPGRSGGAGNLAEGYLELQGTHYVFRGTRNDGVRFGCKVTKVICDGQDISATTEDQINRLDVAGLDFRLSPSGRLDLRTPPE